MIIRDCRGTAINPGDRVMYPKRSGSSMWLVESQVMSLGLDGKSLQVRGVHANVSGGQEYLGRLSTVRSLDRVVIVDFAGDVPPVVADGVVVV